MADWQNQMQAMMQMIGQPQPGGGSVSSAGGKKQPQWQDDNWWPEVPGFQEALQASLAVHVEQDSVSDTAYKLGQKMIKASQKFTSDPRAAQRGTASQAKLLMEEFVTEIMGGIHSSCYDKPWFLNCNLTAPLLALALHTFKDAKVFARTLAPMIEKHVEEAVFKYLEEERITKAIWDALELAGCKESHMKKASKHLATAYDDAHLKSPYGKGQGDTPELGLLMDFIKGWMTEFTNRAHEVLRSGSPGTTDDGPGATKDQKVMFMTILFQYLTDFAGLAAMPRDITALIETPPATPWPFVAQCAETVFNEIEEEQKARKGSSKGYGKDFGKGYGKGYDKGYDKGFMPCGKGFF